MNPDLRDDDGFAERLTAYLDQKADRAEDVAGFEALAHELRAEATWSDPPPGLREAILSRVGAQAAPAPVPVPVPVPKKRARAWGWGRLGWAIPAAAVAAAAFTALIVTVDRALQPGPAAGATYAAVGTQLATGATATVTVSANPSGFSLRLLATGLPAAAPGSYYSAWLHGPRGVVPLGSFHQRRSGDAVALWSGVDPGDYTTLVITLQAEGAPLSPSDLVVMTATLKP
jgi:hypothetical protein